MDDDGGYFLVAMVNTIVGRRQIDENTWKESPYKWNTDVKTKINTLHEFGNKYANRLQLQNVLGLLFEAKTKLPENWEEFDDIIFDVALLCCYTALAAVDLDQSMAVSVLTEVVKDVFK